MQILSELLGTALNKGVIANDDLYTTEPFLIDKLLSDCGMRLEWQKFRAMKILEYSPVRGEGSLWRQIRAKKRHIDPLVRDMGRVSKLNKQFSEELREFLLSPQDEWLRDPNMEG